MIALARRRGASRRGGVRVHRRGAAADQPGIPAGPGTGATDTGPTGRRPAKDHAAATGGERENAPPAKPVAGEPQPVATAPIPPPLQPDAGDSAAADTRSRAGAEPTRTGAAGDDPKRAGIDHDGRNSAAAPVRSGSCFQRERGETAPGGNAGNSADVITGDENREVGGGVPKRDEKGQGPIRAAAGPDRTARKPAGSRLSFLALLRPFARCVSRQDPRVRRRIIRPVAVFVRRPLSGERIFVSV